MRREYTVSSQFDVTLCCRIMLTALCVTCSFAPAWAATFVAAKAACIHGRPACAFVRQSRPKAPLREPFLPLLAPLHAALPCGGWASFHGSLRSRLRRPRSCSTLFYIKARPESILTRRGLCRTTPLNTALFRAGAFQLRSGPPQTVPGFPAFRLRGRFRGWRARIRFPFVPAGSPGMRLPS